MAINNEGKEYKGLEMEGYQEEKSNEKVAKGKKEPGFGTGRNMDFQKGRENSSVPDEDSHGSPLYDMNPDPGAPK